ncbi:MAG TPA: PIN domain-containing protein [Motilibacterales bacterium]|nr:PIN domain-containing protein [Motilibacterales bacterium]
MSSDPRVVLDASALLSWALEERGATTVDKLLAVAVEPVSALVEALYRAVERGHRLAPVELCDALLEMGLEIAPVIAADAVRAAELIAASRVAAQTGSLSLGDGLCIAVAERLQLPITGGDQLWESLDLRVRYLPFR